MRLNETIEIREENNTICLCYSKYRIVELFGDRIIIDFFTTEVPMLYIPGVKRIVINIKEQEEHNEENTDIIQTSI